jgi:maltose O-acetyltransferase
MFRVLAFWVASMLPSVRYIYKLKKQFYRLSGMKIGKGGLIGNGFKIRPYGAYHLVEIGDYVFINQDVSIACKEKVVLENGSMIGPQVMIETNNHTLEFGENGKRPSDPQPVRVKEQAMVCARALILPGVEVGKRAFVAAGAVISKSIPDDVLAGGVPARIIRKLM